MLFQEDNIILLFILIPIIFITFIKDLRIFRQAFASARNGSIIHSLIPHLLFRPFPFPSL